MGRKATPEEIAILEGKAPAAPVPYVEAQKPPAISGLDAYMMSVPRGFGNIASGAKDLFALGMMDPGWRNQIAADEKAAEADLVRRTADYPVQRFLGEMTGPTIVSGGRSPLAAMLRGAATGALMYNEDPYQRVAQVGLGGLLGNKMRGLADEVTMSPLGRRAMDAGLKLTPEEKYPTFLGKERLMENNTAFRMQAYANSQDNLKSITSQFLNESGEAVTRLNDDVVKSIHSRQSNLFDEVKNSKENLFFGTRSSTQLLDALATNAKGKATGNSRKGLKAAGGYAEEIKGIIVQNHGMMPIKEYMRIRSDLTDDILRASSGKKKRALGELVTYLDDNAARNLSGETAEKFAKARDLYKKYLLVKTPNMYDPETGLLDAKKLNNFLTNKDEWGYVLKNRPSRFYEMLRVNRQIAGSNIANPKPGNNLYFRASLNPNGSTLNAFYNKLGRRPAERLGLSANRLPGDLVADVPVGAALTGLNNQAGPTINLNPLLEYQNR